MTEMIVLGEMDLRNPDKVKEVGCLTCNYIMTTKEFSPRCEICNQVLVVVVYSAIDGKRITGNELGPKSS